MRSVALVQTQVLMEIPVPNMAKRLIFSTKRLGRFLISQSGIGLLVCVAMVTFASHLQWIKTGVLTVLGGGRKGALKWLGCPSPTRAGRMRNFLSLGEGTQDPPVFS